MKRRIHILTAAALLILMLTPVSVFGADSSVSITGVKSAKVGDTITVTVTYKGAALGYVNGQLTYDNSKVQYLSGGSSQGDAGLVELKNYASDASGKLTFQVKFRAAAAGRVSLNLETLETQNLDGDQSMGTPSASKTLAITDPAVAQTSASREEKTSQSTEKETTAEPSETATLGTDAPISVESESTDLTPQEEKGAGSLPVFIAIGAALLIVIAIVIMKRGRGK